MWQLSEGRYGCSVPVDLILDLAEELGVTVDLQVFEQRLQEFKVKPVSDPSEKEIMSEQVNCLVGTRFQVQNS